MANTLNSLTTGAGGVQVSSVDTSGDLNIQSGGSTKVAITSSGVALTGLSKASLPTGSVLQVVNATYSTVVTNNTTTYADTGLTATITPTSTTNKILVIYSGQFDVSGGGLDSGGNVALVNGTALQTSTLYSYLSTNLSQEQVVTISQTYLHSPASISAQTYKLQMKVSVYGGTIKINSYAGSSSITLMEIAA